MKSLNEAGNRFHTLTTRSGADPGFAKGGGGGLWWRSGGEATLKLKAFRLFSYK